MSAAPRHTEDAQASFRVKFPSVHAEDIPPEGCYWTCPLTGERIASSGTTTFNPEVAPDGERLGTYGTGAVHDTTGVENQPFSEGVFVSDTDGNNTQADVRKIVERWEYRERLILESNPERKLPDESNLFRLARELKQAGHGPGAVWQWIPHACGRLGIHCGATLHGLADAWKASTAGHAPDLLAGCMTWADLDADRFPLPLDRPAGYQRLTALCYWLGVRCNGKPYIVPRERIAKWLGLSGKSTGRLIQRLATDGVIRLGSDWSYKAGMARSAEYIGPAPTPDAKAP